MFTRSILAVVAVLSLALASQAADKEKKGKKELDPAFANVIRQLFEQYDADKDGMLDKAELGKAFAQSRDVFLAGYDDDNDGKISFEEFEEAGRDYAQGAEKSAQQARKQQEQMVRQAVGGAPQIFLRRSVFSRRVFNHLVRQQQQQQAQPPRKK
jgi:hypothetical protein